MSHLPLKAGVALCAFALIGFTAQANAAPRPSLDGAAGLMILVADEENAEVENLLDPEADEGTPMDAPGGDGAMEAKPEGEMAPPAEGGGDAEMDEMKSEE
jgi:hypothetical protein